MVYFEPNERAWWLKISLSPAANSAPLPGFEGSLRGGKRERKGGTPPK